MTAEGAKDDPQPATHQSDILTLFAVLWAMATLFHVWISPFSQGVLADPTPPGVSHIALSAAALLVLRLPRSVLALGVLATLGVLTCWLEAPLLGNHWLLAAAIDLAFIVAMTVSVRHGRVDVRRVAAAFVPVARWSFAAFYGFAAFAKLNYAFLDPDVSCSVFYGDELQRSLHLGTLDPSSGLAQALPVLVVIVELLIPLLLVLRRTRHAGVILGLLYHSVIGLNMTHPFADFSSVLAAMFVLFLAPSFAAGVVGLARRHARPVKAVRTTALIVATIVLLALWSSSGGVGRRVLLDGRALAWVTLDVTILLLVGRFVRQPRSPRSPTERVHRPHVAVLLIVPALVALNGLTPYLELKTGYGWNMYSNLSTVDGESNHLLVPRTLALSNVQSDLVRIVATNDPGLGLYVSERYDLPFRQVRAYLSEHRGASLVYDRGGQRFLADPAAMDPELIRSVPGWQQKLQPFRAIDQSTPPRCQPAFFPAH